MVSLRRSVLALLAGILFLLVCAVPVQAEALENTEQVTEVIPVRYGPGDSEVEIGYLESGTELTVDGEENGYYSLAGYGMPVYISGEYVALDGETYTAVGKPEAVLPLPRLLPPDILRVRRGACEYAMGFLGLPYVSGGQSRRGFDCSGLTQYVMRDAGVEIARTCLRQLQQGILVKKEDLRPGDLLFFQNTTRQWALTTHVGIYLGSGKLLHAGNSGVSVAELDNQYYVTHYLSARRYFLDFPMLPELTQPEPPEAFQGEALEAVGLKKKIAACGPTRGILYQQAKAHPPIC